MTQAIKYLSIYDTFFSPSQEPKDWASFSSTSLTTPLRQMEVDFSLQDKTWVDTAKQVALFVLKIILWPWGLCAIAKYVAQRVAMIPIYPAQSRIVKHFFTTIVNDKPRKVLSPEFLDWCLEQETSQFAQAGYMVRRVVLEKNGVRYSGLLTGHQNNLSNGNWVIKAVGNGAAYEHSVKEKAVTFARAGFNTLMVNGPSVGKSEGHATPESAGEVQELGLQFLETAVKAKKIAMVGWSLGGGAMGQAIMQHTFQPGIHYHYIPLATFSRVSDVAAHPFFDISPRFASFLKKAVIWLGCEFDNLAASRRLSDMQIPETIIQAGEGQSCASDGVIEAEVCLGRAVLQDSSLRNKTLVLVQNLTHNDSRMFLPYVQAAIKKLSEQ